MWQLASTKNDQNVVIKLFESQILGYISIQRSKTAYSYGTSPGYSQTNPLFGSLYYFCQSCAIWASVPKLWYTTDLAKKRSSRDQMMMAIFIYCQALGLGVAARSAACPPADCQYPLIVSQRTTPPPRDSHLFDIFRFWSLFQHFQVLNTFTRFSCFQSLFRHFAHFSTFHHFFDISSSFRHFVNSSTFRPFFDIFEFWSLFRLIVNFSTFRGFGHFFDISPIFRHFQVSVNFSAFRQFFDISSIFRHFHVSVAFSTFRGFRLLFRNFDVFGQFF
jgi:hypothetical protein